MDYNYNDEYYYEQYDEGDDQYTSEEATVGTIPSFVSEPQHILVNEGDTFNIHCMVDQLGKRGGQTDCRPILMSRHADDDVEEGGPAGGAGREGADQQQQDVRHEGGGGDHAEPDAG